MENCAEDISEFYRILVISHLCTSPTLLRNHARPKRFTGQTRLSHLNFDLIDR